MMTQRTDRIDQLLREEIGAILARDIADPRIGFATITAVETAPDLRHAKVWVSVIGPEPERDETLAALQRAMGYVQRELGHRLRLKRIPVLHVRLDDTAERSTRVMKLLAEIDTGLVAEDLPRGETLPTPVPRIRPAGEPDMTDPEERVDPERSDPPRAASGRRRGRPAGSGERRSGTRQPGTRRSGARPHRKGPKP
jgi:ribosome-binding factor A